MENLYDTLVDPRRWGGVGVVVGGMSLTIDEPKQLFLKLLNN